MKKTITHVVLGLLLLGVFAFNYIQSDGMRLLPFEFHASEIFNKIFAAIVLIYFLGLIIFSVIRLSKKRPLNKIRLILLTVVFAALYLYIAVGVITVQFCNS